MTAPTAPPPASPPGSTLLRLALPFYGVVALFAFGYALFSGGLSTLLGARAPSAAHLAAAVGVGIALIVLSRVLTRAWAPMGRMRDTFVDVIGPIGLGEALAVALLSGVAEELLFRGALWPHLGLVGTTLLFGLVHFLPRRSLWVYPLFALVAGLLLGILREGTQSLVTPAIAHVLLNAVNLVWIGRLARSKAAKAAAPPEPAAD